MAQVMMNQDAMVQKILDAYNGFMPYIFDDYATYNYNVLGVRMSNIDLNGPDHEKFYSYDPAHPGTSGFIKMAGNWLLGIQAADRKGWIKAPEGTFDGDPYVSFGPFESNPTTDWALMCDYNATWSASIKKIFQGPTSIGGNYQPSWDPAVDFTKGAAGKPVGNNYVWLVDYHADGLSDYWLISADTGAVSMWQNDDGAGNWVDLGLRALGSKGTPGAGVIIADANGKL